MKFVNEAQTEYLKEISTKLRQAREQKGLRIEEVAISTHIRQVFLEALDEGRFEDLPEPIYVQGFIRRYADAVGLDGNALADLFASVTLPVESEQYNTNLDTKPSIHIPLIVPYLGLLAVASLGLFYILHPQQTVESKQHKQNTAISSLQKKAPNSLVPSTKASPKLKITSPVEVNVKLEDPSWMRVKADGKTIFEGTLKKGEDKTWTAKKQLTVRAGNAGAVLVSVNKNQPQILGDPDKIKEITYTPETVISH